MHEKQWDPEVDEDEEADWEAQGEDPYSPDRGFDDIEQLDEEEDED
jgi:hypothetical protein